MGIEPIISGYQTGRYHYAILAQGYVSSPLLAGHQP
jgi:hypothetical protein